MGKILGDSECLTKPIVAPKASGFLSGKEGEAGHPRMVDAASTPSRQKTSRLNAEWFL